VFNAHRDCLLPAVLASSDASGFRLNNPYKYLLKCRIDLADTVKINAHKIIHGENHKKPSLGIPVCAILKWPLHEMGYYYGIMSLFAKTISTEILV
jgi:hypothetical protein